MKQIIFDTFERIKTPFIPLVEWYDKQNKYCRYLIIICMVMVASCTAYYSIVGLTSLCKSEYAFSSSEEAIECMRSYLYKMRVKETSDCEQFTKDIKKWIELNDTVAKFLVNDTTVANNDRYEEEYRNIRDSTTQEFLRLTETWKCTFEDVVSIKEKTTPFTNDTTINRIVSEATPFFVGLDQSQKMEATSKEDAILLYRSFLEKYRKSGIHSKKQMLAFIQQEDMVFQNFLQHLYALDNDHISDITQTTEEVCNGIFSAAIRKEIEPEDALVYMAMRTSRRLLQNSSVCMADITKKRMRSKAQANAYLWMLIQPYISIDQFTIATMRAEERQQMLSIAKSLNKSQNFLRTFDMDPKAVSYLLPQQILKMYVMEV